ncbi:MAG: hypothetical protein U1E49_10135 [Hyphomicrobiaceae bacterium]
MGHVRLKSIPRSRGWTQVVDLIGGDNDAVRVARAAARAMTKSLDKAISDPALIQTTYLLALIPGAARDRDAYGAIKGLGLDVRQAFDLGDLLAAISMEVDRDARRRGGRTDLGEMALQSAASSLGRAIAPDLPGLMGASHADLVRALAEIDTPDRFAELARSYFGDLIRRGLEYFTARAYAQHVRDGGRFASLSALEQFREALALHCSESTLILEQYAKDWFSKSKFVDGLSRESVERFTRTALTKLQRELSLRSDTDG